MAVPRLISMLDFKMAGGLFRPGARGSIPLVPGCARHFVPQSPDDLRGMNGE
jgi:hypothetical protein